MRVLDSNGNIKNIWTTGALDTLPVGSSITYTGTSAPSGYLTADGSAVSRTVYASLFSVLGTTFGTGDGSTTFNLPNETVTIPPPAGRLTLTSATPVTTTDVTGAGTLYYTPYNGNSIMLYSNSSWWTFPFTEVSLSLTITSGSNYDVFAYNNNGTVALELSSAWNGNNARFGSGTYATNLPTLNGVFVKSTDGSNTDPTRRYLGTIRASGTNVTADAVATRYVWNAYNRTPRALTRQTGDTSWTYTTATWRQANANAANKVECVTGLLTETVHMEVRGVATGSGGNVAAAVGVGVNSTSSNSAQLYGNWINSASYQPIPAVYDGFGSIGYNAFNWLEISQASGTTTWYGSNSPELQSGMQGYVWA